MVEKTLSAKKDTEYCHDNEFPMAENVTYEWTSISENDILEFEDMSDEEEEEEEEESTQDYYFSDTSNSASTSTSTSASNSYPKKERHQRRRIFKRRKEKAIKKALLELRSNLEDALQGDFLFGYAHLALLNEQEREGLANLKDIALWGVPLLPSKRHEGTDIVLLKFLKAQSYKVNDALEMLRKTLIWRIKEKIDHISEEKFGDDQEELDKVVFIEGVDKLGHPVCFNVYGAFKDRNLFNKYFGTEKSRRDFIRWRVQFMEKSIKKLNFTEDGVHSFLLISDMKNVPGHANKMKELGPVSKEAFNLFQQYYPELIYKHIIINTPFWYYLYHGVLTQYCTHGTKKKFVLARPYYVTETLLKCISPGNIPLCYGGFGRPNDDEFTSDDQVLEFNVRAGCVAAFKIPVSESNVTILWEVMVVGWDVTYKDEFIPDDEGSYRILLSSEKKITESVRNSFYINEPGRILITIKNITYIKKKVFIRRKSKITLPVYMTTYDHHEQH